MITKELIESFEIGLPKRLTIDGKTSQYETRKVPISYLYYNDMNGRIATYIEEYNDTHEEDIRKLFATDLNKYNDELASYVKKSAMDDFASFNVTKEDIRNKLQQEPGVILDDGRVIDGNRRFTAIRELYKETGDPRFAKFETVILPTPAEDDEEQWRIIKSLELNLQFNKDEKRTYNKIDLLVSLYRDVFNSDTAVFTKQEYCFASGIKAADMNKNENIIKVMLDYLEWIGRPKCFYILKNEKLDGPLEELAGKFAKCSEDEWNSQKDVFFNFMTFKKDGDRTREIRELIKSSNKGTSLFKTLEDNINKPEVINKIVDAVSYIDKPVKDVDETKKKQEALQEAQKELVKAYDRAKEVAILEKTTKEPVEKLEKALSILKEVDIKHSDFSQEEYLKIKQFIGDIKKRTEEIEKEYADAEFPLF